MSTEIKNTLFSFSTLRLPGLVSDANKALGFVFHPEFDETHEKFVATPTPTTIFKGVLSAPKETPALQFVEVLSAAGTLQPNKTIKVKADVADTTSLEHFIGSQFYKYSNAVAKLKKSTITNKTQVPSSSGVGELSLTQKVDLWDNLFVLIVTQKNAPLRDAILHAIITNHYIANQANPNALKALRASVVIPAALFSTSAAVAMQTRKSDETKSKLSLTQLKELKGAQIVFDQQLKIDDLVKLKEEVTTLHDRYQKNQAQKLNDAQRDFQAATKAAYKNATMTETSYENKVTGIVTYRQHYANLTLPEYTYVAESELDNYLTEFLGRNEVLELLQQEAPETITGATEIIAIINRKIKEANNIISKYTPPPSKRSVIIAGTKINLSGTAANRSSNLIPVQVIANHLRTDSTPFNPAVLQKWKNFVVNASYINESDLNTEIDPVFKVVASNGVVTPVLLPARMVGANYVKFIGFNNMSPVMLMDNTTAHFKGTIYLVDGTLEIDIPFYVKVNNSQEFSGAIGAGASVFQPTVVIPPVPDPTDPPADPPVNPAPPDPVSDTFIPSGFGIRNLGIADYKKVEQEICCYEPGEVSHIENIMAREYKEKSTERSRIVDTTTTNSSEQETENLTDTSTTSRNEMHKEVAKVLQEDSQIGLNAEVHYGNTDRGGSVNGSFAHNSAEDDSTIQSMTYAQEITERAMSRIVARTKSEIITKVIESYRENNKHGFDNTTGTEHVSGVYRWVNKVYNNQLVNYGKRAMIEFMIPEPARFHILASVVEGDRVNRMKEPIDPRSEDAGIYRIETYKDVAITDNPDNYVYWASVLGIELDEYPALIKSTGKSFTKSEAEDDGGVWDNKAISEEIELPEGYNLDIASVSYYYKDGGDAVVSVIVANQKISDGGSVSFLSATTKYTNKIPISVAFNKVAVANVNVVLSLTRSAEFYLAWQNRVFSAIIEAYEDRLKRFNDEEDEVLAQEKERYAYNSMYYRQIERNALKKNIMHYLVDDKYIGQNHLTDQTSEILMRPKNDQSFDDNATVAKFMEQAFEWDILSYTFYPYFWGNDDYWKANYNYQFDDALFTNFMQAGMARVILTVRPGFEKTVNWYMATGQVWNGGQVPTLGDDLFLSIDEELKDTKPVPEGLPWKTTLPSDLVVIQKGTIALDATGLPCKCPDTVGGEVENQALIKGAVSLIGGIDLPPKKEKLIVKDGLLQLQTEDGTETLAQVAVKDFKEDLGL